jgi:hypothetical protein
MQRLYSADLNQRLRALIFISAAFDNASLNAKPG